MKTITASVFILFNFHLLNTQSSFLFGVATAANDAVLDLKGEQVLTGYPYFVVSETWGDSGRGLAIGRKSDRKCPEIVVQRRNYADYGDLVVFSNANSTDGIVRVSSDVRVRFVVLRDGICHTSTVWKVEREGELSGKRWIELGGSEGEPGCDNVESWFKLEMETAFSPDIHLYKFKYCPSVCSSSVTSCNAIAKYEDADGQVRLALSDDGKRYQNPSPWRFVKVYGDARIQQVVHA